MDGANPNLGQGALCPSAESLRTLGRLALFLAAGRDRDLAALSPRTLVFEKMLLYGNHRGVYCEEFRINGRATEQLLSAFTDLALISAAINLDRQLG